MLMVSILLALKGFKIKHILNSGSTLYGENKINQLEMNVKKLCHGANAEPKVLVNES